MLTKLRNYQTKGVRMLHKFGGRALLADEMGLGKSLTSLTYVRETPEAKPAIVICPASLKWNWEREAKVHVQMRAEVLEGTKVPKRKRLLSPHQLVILNYDILKYWMEFLQGLDPQIIILDEAHYLQSPSSQRTKMVRLLCKGVPHVLALTGTPLVNRPAELWPVLNILRPKLYKHFRPFAFRYCQPRRTPWGWQFKGATRLDELHRNLKDDLMIRRLKSEVLKELPAKTRIVLPLELSSSREYREAERDIVQWLYKQGLTKKASNAARAEKLAKLSYLKQLAAQLKLPAVFRWIDDFLQEDDGKIVVFGFHRKILGALEERYKSICVKIDGSVVGKKRQHAVDQFQTHKKTRLLFGNLKAAGVGLNLTAAKTVAKVELGWHPGGHIQAEDRIHRIGQAGSVTCYYLIGRGTIEEDLCKLIQAKQEVLDAALDGGSRDDRMDIFDQLEKKLLRRGGR